MRSWTLKLAVGSALVLGTVAGATGFEAIRDGHASTSAAALTRQAQMAPAEADTAANDLSRAFRNAARGALPGVVHIRVEATRQVAGGGGMPDALRGTPLEDFFRQAPRSQEPRPVQGSGSGFVFRADGYILTNNHVVEGAERVTVITNDRREYQATVVGRDPNTDIAVLKVEAASLPVIPFGDSDGMQVGDWVVALGYPLELGSTVTAGIVSAKGRSIGIIGRSQEPAPEGAAPPLEAFIQTDAAINPGNSGGPLVDLNGRVVGINSAIASRTGYYQGYGFAVPAKLAQRVAADLIEHGEVRRPRIGVGVSTVESADQELFDLPDMNGAVVTLVEEGLPAERAGIELGDVIVRLEGQPIGTDVELIERLALHEPGERVRLGVWRDGSVQEVTMQLARFQAAPVAAAPEPARERGSAARLGFEAREITPRLAQEFRLNVREGVVVTDVVPGGPAPLGPGMVILELSDQKIEDIEDLEDAAAGIAPGDPVKLIVLYQGRRQLVTYRTR